MVIEEISVLHFLFASPNTQDKNAFGSIEGLDSVCEDTFSVVLSSRKELEILLSLLGVDDFVVEDLPNSEDFYDVIDISQHKFPELSESGFDQFYEQWLLKTGREPNMDEYGQLIFIQGQAQKWNQRSNRVILNEKDCNFKI